MSRKKERKLRYDLWEITEKSYRKIHEEYQNTDPSDPKYDEICKHLESITKTIDDMRAEDKKLMCDNIKFGIGIVFSAIQTAIFGGITLIGMDWEQANSMRSRFAPKVLDMLPKSVKAPKDSY